MMVPPRAGEALLQSAEGTEQRAKWQTLRTRRGARHAPNEKPRRALTSTFPGWEEATNWTLILERRSLAFTLSAGALFCFSLLARFGLRWHPENHLRVPRFRLREQALRVVQVLFTRPS
jgi:hypothetical protein